MNQLHRALNQPYVNKTSNWSASSSSSDGEKTESTSSDPEAGDRDNDNDERPTTINKKNVSWPRSRKLWWQLSRIRPRGFLSFDIIESTLANLGKLFGKMMGFDENEEADYQNPGVNYKDHQLLRITPKSKKQVQYLQELKDNLPDDVKFWTFPAKKRLAFSFTTYDPFTSSWD